MPAVEVDERLFARSVAAEVVLVNPSAAILEQSNELLD